MRVVRVVLILAVALLMAFPVLAQEKKGKRGAGGFDPMRRILAGLNLTDEQKTKIAEVNKTFEAKGAEARKQMASILTDDQKKARTDAETAARDAGKKGREVAAAADEAMKLTDAQKSKRTEAGKAARALMRERMDAIMAVLTTEQQDQVKKLMEEAKKKRAENKKKRDQ